MNKWFGIFNFIGAGFLLLMLATLHRQLAALRVEYDTERLTYAIESSAEAAFLFALNSGNLGISYLDVDAVSLSPSFTLDVFEEMIALNYGMSICEETKSYIEECIPTSILACNDGYYITKLGAIGGDVNGAAEGELGFYWSVKNPYLIEEGGGEEATAISVRIGTEKWIKSSLSGGKYSLSYGDSYTDSEVRGKLTKEKVQRSVNTTLANAFAYSMEQVAELRGRPEYNVYLPASQTSSGINNVAGPSLIIVLQGADFSGEAKVEEAVISGFKTTKKVYLVGFVDVDGMKRYCYEGQLPKELEDSTTGFFYTLEEAAGQGYLPAYRYLGKPIS